MRVDRPGSWPTRIWVGLIYGCLIAAVYGEGWAQSRDPVRGAARAASCAACHGGAQHEALAGVPWLAGQQHEFLVLQMFFLREGLRDVPQMAGLLKGYTDGDFEDIAAYYARQAPVAAKAAVQSVSALHARGADLAKSMGCGSCHMADYGGQKHVPRITGQQEAYLAATLTAYRDNKRTGTDTSMNAAMYQVTDADIAALAHYFAYR